MKNRSFEPGKRHGPKPRHGETMVPVSIRMRQSEIDEIDTAAIERSRKMNAAWSRTDEIRDRLQDTFAANTSDRRATAVRDDEVLAELRAVRDMLARFLANGGGGRR